MPPRRLTRDELAILESRPKTKVQKFLDYVVCFLPVVAGCVALWEYNFLSDLQGNVHGNDYNWFILALTGLALIGFFASF